MTKEDIKRLEGYSRAFAKELFRCFPAWLEYASLVVTGEPGLHVNYLEVRLPSRNPRVEEPLVINTERCEVTVSWFGGWHVHVPTGPEQPRPGDFDKALELIRSIVGDRYVVAVKYRGDRPAGGIGYLAPAERPLCLRNAATVKIRSWCGTHDRDEDRAGF